MRAAARPYEFKPPQVRGLDLVKILEAGGRRRPHAPAAGGGDGRVGAPVFSRAFARAFCRAAQHQRHAAGLLGGELQAPAGGEVHVLHFAHHGGQDSGPQSFLHGGEQVLVAARLGDDQMLGAKPHGGEAGAVQLASARAPQHGRGWASGPQPANKGCGEAGDGGETAQARFRARDLMERATRQTALGPERIEGRDSERQRGLAGLGPEALGPLKAAQGLLEMPEGGRCPAVLHEMCVLISELLSLLCSSFVLI